MFQERVQENLRPIESLAENVFQNKLKVREQAVAKYHENSMVGLEVGYAYKDLVYGLVTRWYEENVPEKQKDCVGIASFGSTARGELCFYSDTDLAIVHNGGVKKETVNDLRKGLLDYLENAGLLPEVKIWGLRDAQIELFQRDLVQSETISSAETVAGEPIHLEALQHDTHFDPQHKALFTVFELKKPRFMKDEEGVFNIKWEKEGGLVDFLALRCVAAARGVAGKTTVEVLVGLESQRIITREECQFLCSAVSEYMIYRNEMHIFAGDTAERLGPRTRRYIRQHIPAVSSPEELNEHIEQLRLGVYSITRKVIHDFLRNMDIDPEVYENFDTLPIDTQLDYVHSPNLHYSELAAWSSEEDEVLGACLETNPSWSTLNAVTRSECCSSEVLSQAELLTRDKESLVFARLQLAVNPSTAPKILVELFQHTNDDRVRSMVRKRLAHILYDQHGEIPDEIKHIVDGIVFYPPHYFPEGLFQKGEKIMQPTEGKLFLNFAGRLAKGKNLIPYLTTLGLLHQKGIDFEAHVFGSAEPITVDELHEFWKELDDPSLIGKIIYHGKYTPAGLRRELTAMQNVGFPVFLYPKGLVSKELLSAGVPIITTKQGNYDIEMTGLCPLDESKIGANLVNGVVIGEIENSLKRTQEIEGKSRRGMDLIRERYSLEQWGKQIGKVIEEIRPGSKNVLLLGTTALTEPHGPAVWSENLLTYLGGTNLRGRYVYPYENIQPLIPIPNTYSGERLTPEVEAGILNDLSVFTRSVMAISTETDLSVIMQAEDVLIRLAHNQNAIRVLSSQRAYNTFSSAVLEAGYDPLELSYQSLVFDEENIYGTLIKPYLKVARWLHLLQTDLPEADVIITHGTLNPLLGIREKRENGKALIHVDHVLASEEPLLKGILDNNYYTDTERGWFANMNTLARRMAFMRADRYLALWPANHRIAVEHYGMPEGKVVYIPNGINEKSV